MTYDALLLAPAALAVVLVWSAVGKVHAGSDARLAAVADLGAPAWLRRRALADLHPWVELALAVGLLVQQAPLLLVPALGAAVLMALYLLLVVRALRAADGAACACFGADSMPVTRRTVLRNGVLLGLALLALVDAASGHGFVDRLREQGAEGVLWLVGAGVVALVVATVAGGGGDPIDAGDVLPDDEMLERRPVDPALVLLDEQGGPHLLGDLAATHPQLLVFGSPGCAACSATYREMAHYDGILSGIGVRYVIAGEPAPLTQPSEEFPVWFDPHGTVARGVGAPEHSPCSVLVGVDGLTAGEAVGTAQVRAHVGSLAIQLAPLPHG